MTGRGTSRPTDRLGVTYWVLVPAAALLAAVAFGSASRVPAPVRPLVLVVGAVLVVYALYLLLLPVVVWAVAKGFTAFVDELVRGADRVPDGPRPRRRSAPPAPRGRRHWVDDGSTRLVRRRLLVDDRGRVLLDDVHDRRTDVLLAAGLVSAVAVVLVGDRLGGALGGVAFALGVLGGCVVLAAGALRVVGRVAVSRLNA